MKRALRYAFLAGAVVAIAVAGIVELARWSRPNLLANGGFDSAETMERGSWVFRSPDPGGAMGIASEGGDRYLFIDSRGIGDPDRDPFERHSVGQSARLGGRGGNRVSLSGRLFLETSGAAVVQLRAHGWNGWSGQDGRKYDGEPGKWVHFRLTASTEKDLDAADAVLGVIGETRARFDDLDMVLGPPRGGELARFLFVTAVVLVVLAISLTGLEIAYRGASGA